MTHPPHCFSPPIPPRVDDPSFVKDCWAAARESGALDLLEKAAKVFKELNGEEDKSLESTFSWLQRDFMLHAFVSGVKLASNLTFHGG